MKSLNGTRFSNGASYFRAASPLLNGAYQRLMLLANAGKARAVGTLIDRRWDRDREHVKIVAGVIACPKCRRDVELISETQEWIRRSGRWEHRDYGPGSGECCDNFFIESIDGGCLMFKGAHDAKGAKM